MNREIVVFCDKPTDAKLFNYLKGISPVLSQIPGQNVRVLPDRRALPPEYVKGFGELLDYDRADYYFCFREKPFLVVEMTEHGYTGDQCMQRFARIVKTAEMRIPFLYFAPTSRTRYDELDDASPSFRNVSADMYEGFVRLTEIFETPVIALPWGTGENGIPLILGQDDPDRTGISTLFGLIDSLVCSHFDEMVSGETIAHAAEIQPFIEATRALSLRKNVYGSEVKIPNLSFGVIENLILNPQKTFDMVPREYFYKGKAFKLLAFMSIEFSRITKAILPDNTEIPIAEFIRRCSPSFAACPWLYYYSGYQWRSEPNVGIVTNIDINMCRTQYGRTIFDRKQLLCVHWPRIFWDSDSPVRKQLLREAACPKTSPVLGPMARAAQAYSGKTPNLDIIRGGSKVFGAWSDRATVARIYRKVCDLVILNDAVIVGNKWRAL